tara:strand:+ start:1258 stop:2325 length:1068 start_codon:yes stop_codon:yes gene_type:complete
MALLEDLDAAWASFSDAQMSGAAVPPAVQSLDGAAPEPTAIYISTKTKISYLNSPIDLASVFWETPVIPYHEPREGVVKKQMKFNSISPEELSELQARASGLDCVEEHILQRIVNPEGRIKFKDVRKISIGLAKKDIVSYRRKKRGAFYNCFVMILRVRDADCFKEIHVKVFNTGKLEIPGIQDTDTLTRVLHLVIDVLRPLKSTCAELACIEEKTETVLINSNFNCGYFIDRDKLYHKLRYEYEIDSAYDPCSYPGIQSTFYHDNQAGVQTGRQPAPGKSAGEITKVSFMVFRTGSVLIVGKCTESVLDEIYVYLKGLLKQEYREIGCPGVVDGSCEEAKRHRKARRKTLVLGS